MKKKIVLPLLLLMLLTAFTKVHAADYLVTINLKNAQLNEDVVFHGDTTVRFHTSGKDKLDRHTIASSDSWEIAMSFEIKPGGKDPVLKKYGVKGKTWQYICHVWYRETGGTWKELSGGPLWQHIQRDTETEIKQTTSVKGGGSGVTSSDIKYKLGIRKE